MEEAVSQVPDDVCVLTLTLVCFCVFTTQCAERSIPQGGRVR